jgi:hypothetical protein
MTRVGSQRHKKSIDLRRSGDDLCCGIEGHDKLHFATTFHGMQSVIYTKYILQNTAICFGHLNATISMLYTEL